MDYIFNSIKEYPDMIKVYIYREPIRSPQNRNRHRRKDPETSEASIIRTKTAISDLCLCNQFDLFCTFTFDPKRFNSKSIVYVKKYINTWCHNAKSRHSKALQYLIIPERHKSGAYHLHALIKGYNGRLRNSGHKQGGRTVYNIPNWSFGFSTAVKIDNQLAVSKYIQKYITKDMVLFPGKKRYFCSQGLKRPEKQTNFMGIIPFLRSVPSEFRADNDKEIYTIFKKDLDAIHQNLLK